MDDPALPIVIGSSGLTGRPQVRPAAEIAVDDDGNAIQRPDPHGPAIPPNCLRSLHSPLGADCRNDCPGRMRDGSCLAQLAREANAAGIEWRFEIDPRDNTWIYVGPPLPVHG